MTLNTHIARELGNLQEGLNMNIGYVTIEAASGFEAEVAHCTTIREDIESALHEGTIEGHPLAMQQLQELVEAIKEDAIRSWNDDPTGNSDPNVGETLEAIELEVRKAKEAKYT